MSETAPARPWYDLVIETIAMKGITKAQLSERSGVARNTIDRWQRTRRKPQAKSVNAVADVLGIDRGRALRLAGVVGDAPEPEPEPVSTIPPEVMDLIRRKYPPEVQQLAIDALEAIGRGEPYGEAGSSQSRAG